MGLLIVDRYAKKLDILFLEFVVRITERTCFLGSARSIVFRIEEKHDALSFEIGELDGLAILILRFEVRCFVAFFEHKPPERVGFVVGDCSIRFGISEFGYRISTLI